jgi:hypothetical protein
MQRDVLRTIPRPGHVECERCASDGCSGRDKVRDVERNDSSTDVSVIRPAGEEVLTGTVTIRGATAGRLVQGVVLAGRNLRGRGLSWALNERHGGKNSQRQENGSRIKAHRFSRLYLQGLRSDARRKRTTSWSLRSTMGRHADFGFPLIGEQRLKIGRGSHFNVQIAAHPAKLNLPDNCALLTLASKESITLVPDPG